MTELDMERIREASKRGLRAASMGSRMTQQLRVLIACEFSGTVRRAFDALGHDVWSCGLWTEGEGPDGRGYVYVCGGGDSFRIGDAAINRATEG